jgi:uncharacterized protein
LFLHDIHGSKPIVRAELWCLGYLHGAALVGDWPTMPEDMEKHLGNIAMHCDDEYLQEINKQPLEIQQSKVDLIEPAVRVLHAHWLAYRMSSMDDDEAQSIEPIRSEAKIGRNDPCPCGSGKKFKKCCLH